MKLFKVTKEIVPEWGETEIEFEKYFLANSKETVEDVVRSRFGENGCLEHYYAYDRSEMFINILELEVQVL